MRIDPSTIRHSGSVWIRLPHSDDPRSCPHRWEFHLWEHGEAYCNQCGSFAKALNDPRCEEPWHG